MRRGDGSPAILEAHGARVLRVPPESFDHGTTRNLAAGEARSPVVVFLSQDAVPAGPRFVLTLVETLEADPRLAGAFARQVPRENADPLTRRDLAAWVAGSPAARVVFLPEPEALSILPPLERHRLLAFDDAPGAAEAVRRVTLDYDRHRRAARRIAEEHLDSRAVLSRLLHESGAS